MSTTIIDVANVGASDTHEELSVVGDFVGAEYDTSTRSATAGTIIGPLGVGDAYAWSLVGVGFESAVDAFVNIRVVGDLVGNMAATVAAGASYNAVFYVWDLTTDTLYNTGIGSDSVSIVNLVNIDQTFSKGMGIGLQEGHQYIAFVYLETAAVIASGGMASSDFTPYDYDDYGEKISYDYIAIDWIE